MKRAARAPRPRAPLLVVGIGASAGGLQPLRELLSAIAAGSDLAVVVVQHLEAGRESRLAELLGRAAALPVRELRRRTRITRGAIYVAAPGTQVRLEGGELRVLARRSAGARGGIDAFFDSLAAACGEHAIGVVLSGAAHDGAAGLQRIHAAGGMTFAQDPATAAHPSMPQAAIDTGAVDRILPPVEIGRALSGGERTSTTRATKRRSASTAVPAAMLERALEAIRSSTGIDLSGYKRATLTRRLQRRLMLLGMPVAEYVARLESDPEEARRLHGELMIHVSGFFRDEAAYAALAREVYPTLASAERAETPIRIWVPGCANGQEVYSIAISLLEHLEARGRRTPVRIFGTDVDEEAVERARNGIYAESFLASVSAERLKKYFERHDGGFRVTKAVRSVCTFVRHDLLGDPPFSNLDLVSFRNVMIYFGAAAQKRALGLIHYALRPGGFLMIGSAETARALPGAFVALDGEQKLFRRREGRHATPEIGSRGFPLRRISDAPGARWTPFDIHSAADRAMLMHIQVPALVVDDELRVVQFRGDTHRFVDHAPGEASLRLPRLLHGELVAAVSQGIETARRGEPFHRRDCVRIDPITKEASPVWITVLAIAPPSGDERFFVVLFEEGPAGAVAPGAASKPASPTAARLTRELAATRRQMRDMVQQHEQSLERMRSGSDEVLSSNEELQSINEELETAKEELQSSYEELTTVNEELQSRNVELSQANNDLINVLATVDVSILMLDSERRIRLFTPRAGEILNLIASDVGRPITDIRTGFAPLEQGKLDFRDREVRDRSGHWYSIAVRPYTTAAGVAEGTVIALIDIDDRKRALQRTEGARALAEEIVETVQQPLLVLDDQLAVRTANRAFTRALGDGDGRAEGVGAGARALIEALQPRLDEVLATGKGLRDARVDLPVDGDGTEPRRLRATVRRVIDGDARLLVLALETP